MIACNGRGCPDTNLSPVGCKEGYAGVCGRFADVSSDSIAKNK